MRMRARNCIVLVLLALSALPAWADFAAGLSAYQKGDYDGALKEWQPLAESGEAIAQFNVGLMYYEGQGVRQDYARAAEWFQRAADQGYLKAQYNLGAMYGVGKGVKRDFVEAYMWLDLCAANGDSKCVAQRDLVAKKLSASKLATAQRLASEWKPKEGHEQ
jgi:TPR repeat protein